MSPDRAVLRRAIERGERQGGSVEFKERLTEDLHLAEGRLESLTTQLHHRVLSGDGEATYVVAVMDERGFDLSDRTPREITGEELASCDLVATMGVRRSNSMPKPASTSATGRSRILTARASTGSARYATISRAGSRLSLTTWKRCSASQSGGRDGRRRRVDEDEKRGRDRAFPYRNAR